MQWQAETVIGAGGCRRLGERTLSEVADTADAVLRCLTVGAVAGGRMMCAGFGGVKVTVVDERALSWLIHDPCFVPGGERRRNNLPANSDRSSHSQRFHSSTLILPLLTLALFPQRIPHNSTAHLRIRIRPNAHLARNLIAKSRCSREIPTRELFDFAFGQPIQLSCRFDGLEIQVRAVRVRRAQDARCVFRHGCAGR